MTPQARSARITAAPDGATLAPIRTGIVHGPPRRCEITGCTDPAMHVGGRRCAPHAFAPCLSREPLPLRGSVPESMPSWTRAEIRAEVRAMIGAPPRRGAYYCRHCGAAEAMPGHEC